MVVIQETLHETHLLKLLDKMYKYEMDPTRIVAATERTRDAVRMDGHMDGRMDGWTDGQMEWNQYTPPTTLLCEGYNNVKSNFLQVEKESVSKFTS